MAEKRMFTQKIIDSDAFLDMPLSAQALYFHLNMRADDDGFVNNPKRVTKLVSASEDDLKILLMKRFVIGFSSGVIVIKHWRMHNTLKSDRYHPTDYQEEFAQLGIKPNKSYTELHALPEEHVEPEWNQHGTNMEPENRKDLVLEESSKEDITLSDESVCCPQNMQQCRPKDVQAVVDAWNTLGIQNIKKVPPSTTKTGQMLRSRIHEYGIGSVLEAVDIVRRSDFLMGRSSDFMITLDWFVRPNNFPKVVNGNYENRDKKQEAPRRRPSYTTAAEYNPPSGIDIEQLKKVQTLIKTD